MKQGFQKSAQQTPDITFYYGSVVNDWGEWKLEWNDPDEGSSLLSEEDLIQKETESRMKLDPSGDRNEWIKQRNINYSAEYGLKKLQDYKIKMHTPLQRNYSPIIR